MGYEIDGAPFRRDHGIRRIVALKAAAGSSDFDAFAAELEARPGLSVSVVAPNTMGLEWFPTGWTHLWEQAYDDDGAMSLYEHRHELAVLRALGGRRSQLTRLIALELAPLAILGVAVGVVAGYFAAMAIMSVPPVPNRRSNTARGRFSIGSGVVSLRQEIVS